MKQIIAIISIFMLLGMEPFAESNSHDTTIKNSDSGDIHKIKFSKIS